MNRNYISNNISYSNFKKSDFMPNIVIAILNWFLFRLIYDWRWSYETN